MAMGFREERPGAYFRPVRNECKKCGFIVNYEPQPGDKFPCVNCLFGTVVPRPITEAEFEKNRGYRNKFVASH